MFYSLTHLKNDEKRPESYKNFQRNISIHRRKEKEGGV